MTAEPGDGETTPAEAAVAPRRRLLAVSLAVLAPLAAALALLGHAMAPDVGWPLAFAPLVAATIALLAHAIAVDRVIVRPATAREHTHRAAVAAERADARLTQRDASREVHHRVKNNLQVIASVISLHARAARSDEAASAYAAIQRRVEAMAVVQRNHLADVSQPAAIGLRTLLGEVGTNLCASYPADAPSLVLNCEPLEVTPEAALALAFLMVELVELAALAAPPVAVTVEARRDGAGGRFTVRSAAFAVPDALAHPLGARSGRVIDGLVRQLRGKLERDGDGFATGFHLIASRK